MAARTTAAEEPEVAPEEGLPTFPGGGLPAPEPARRRFLIRGVTLLAVAVSLAYLTWRAGFTVDLSSWWVSIPFLALEAHALLSLCLFAFSLWEIDRRPTERFVRMTHCRVAVLVPTYNEPREVLLPTIAAAVALEPAHETWVLDDGNRPNVEQLATELGAKYLARVDRAGAKAGNINNALAHIDTDFIAILDADHVAAPGFLKRTLGYFADERVAIVQTPQDFYNLESFEHEDSSRVFDGERPLYHEQQLFYRVIQPGKNRWEAAFWCGTGAVVRVNALREVGGVATDTVTEDIHTTVKLHRRGWKTVYHNEVLARGLAAASADQFQLQRYRWGVGAMQLLRTENPLIVPGLRLTQRVAYAATLLGWFEAWRSLGYVLLPPAVLLTGGMPVQAMPLTFAIAFGTTFGLQQAALRMLSRGNHQFVLPIVFDLVRMTPNLLATLTLVVPRRHHFQVTPKGKQADLRQRTTRPPLLVTLACLNAIAAVWFGMTTLGQTPAHYDDLLFAFGAAFWLFFNTGLILVAIRRTSSTRYGPERRNAVRFPTGLPGTLDGIPCVIEEISLTGAQVMTAGPVPTATFGPLDRHGLTVGALGQSQSLKAAVQWRRPQAGSGHVLLGLQFTENQTMQQARLALALLNKEVLPLTPVERNAAA